jgi:hypothetical protein
MYNNEQSPLAYLAAFALSFAAGALTVLCVNVYAHIKQDNDEPNHNT